VLLRVEIACYFALSRLALDAHCSPEKTQFITFRGIVYSFVPMLLFLLGASLSRQNLFGGRYKAAPAVICLEREIKSDKIELTACR